MFGLDLESCDYTPIDDNYGTIEYNDLTLYVSKDLEWFCITRLYKALKYDKTNGTKFGGNRWFKQCMKPKLKSNWPDLYHKVEGPGTQYYKGIYVHISLLSISGFSIEPLRFQHWLMGEPWQEANKSGIIYLVQPPRCVGTNIIKIGQTMNFRQRLTNSDYGKGTIVLATVKTNNLCVSERHLIKLFQDNGAINRKDYGKEYFVVTSLDEAKLIFSQITKRVPELLEGKVLRYRTGSWIHGYENEEEE